jgi:hypothetical protein
LEKHGSVVFEDIEECPLARKPTCMVYQMIKDQAFEQAKRTRAGIRKLINYIEKYTSRAENPTVEPLNR